jgi:putative redox protein
VAAPVRLELAWEGDQRFAGRAGEAAVRLDGRGEAGPTPVQALAFSLAGCMAIDVVHILGKGRVAPAGLRARLHGERAPEDPRRLVEVSLHFEIEGDVPPDKVERAIALSREKYCSVWHTIRPDLDFRTSFEIRPRP